MTGTIAFVQGYGRRNLFSGVPSSSLFGWRRNVGLLIALLERAGVPWSEVYAPTLEGLNLHVDQVILRDARYGRAEVDAFRRRHPGLPVLAMLFQAPEQIVERQCTGEARALFGAHLPVAEMSQLARPIGVFGADRVIVRTKANAVWHEAMGHTLERMVLLPHAPMWRRTPSGVGPAERAEERRTSKHLSRFTVLFVGDNLLRKGFFRLYRAFRRLPTGRRRLIVVNRALSRLRAGDSSDIPRFAEAEARKAVADPTVEIRSSYSTSDEMAKLHAECDVLVCPSVLDVGPNTLVEAWQLGTPAIASEACGAVEDLPPISRVSAPSWWRDGAESAEAFTDRLAEALERAHAGSLRCSPPSDEDVLSALQGVVRVWQDLLPGLFS